MFSRKGFVGAVIQKPVIQVRAVSTYYAVGDSRKGVRRRAVEGLSRRCKLAMDR